MTNKHTKLTQATEMLKAIAQPIRQLLENNKKMSAIATHEALNIEKSVASPHLRILKNKGIDSVRKKWKILFLFS
ncbi:MAG: hypothetical protein RQ875_01030 [Vicingaceae bacterium]|nr:hypothetical protein [Vicingaceae bacterium]